MGRKKKEQWEKEIDKDIKYAEKNTDRLKKIGDYNLSLWTNNLQQGNAESLLRLVKYYANKTKELQKAVNMEHEIGLTQGSYEKDEQWKEILKQERAKCLESAGSYDIDDASINQHKYIGGFEAINRILKDI